MITIDSTATGNAPGSTSLTFPHTIGSGSTRALAVCVQTSSNYPNRVRFNGVDLIDTGASGNTADNVTFGSIWVLANPDVGTHDIVIQRASSGEIAAVSTSFFDVDESVYGAVNVVVNNATNSVSDTLNLLYPNSMSLEGQMMGNVASLTVTQDNGQISSGFIETASNWHAEAATKLFSSPGPQTLGFTLNHTTEVVHSMIELIQNGVKGVGNLLEVF